MVSGLIVLMNTDRNQQVEWLEWSGLPGRLNELRTGGWLVFKKLVELDCRAHRQPGTVEVSLVELGQRCGLSPEKAGRIIEVLRRRKYLRCYVPDHPEEEGLFEIRTPINTPVAPEEVARRVTDPHLRDAAGYRYAHPAEQIPLDEKKVQETVDCYLNTLSQKMNSFILDQIEIAARRFPLEAIRHTIERADRHNIRSMGWVLQQLIRDEVKKKKAKKSER